MNFIYKLHNLFCRHKNNVEVICWHWTHGQYANEPRFLEIEYKCNECGKYFIRYINDPRWYDYFTEKYKDKEWSETCKPVLKKEK